ncbi:MAG: hypothetical protein Q8M88_13230 [Phenylobacterium sp.]|nr:hypothetical protein [Phenylobacterium sp.]MDP3175389.1 hypothetical protein [Phenylobacterium sp.]
MITSSGAIATERLVAASPTSARPMALVIFLALVSRYGLAHPGVAEAA